MREFGKNEYDNFIYVNCDHNSLAEELLRTDYDIPRIILGLKALSGEPIDPEKTLIIFDEIQEIEGGLHLLKYFDESPVKYHVMAAGSMLGVTLNRVQSFPVGKVDMLHLFPLDFEEFLLAKVEDSMVEAMYSEDWALIKALSPKFITLLRQYYFTGGMPEAVGAFVSREDPAEVRYIQQNIIDSYRRDISKHTSKVESIRIGNVFDSIPSQLTKENKKFIYGLIKSGARASQYEVSIQWLIDAGIVYKVCRVNKPGMPLKFYEDLGAYKLFLLDIGLLGCLADVPAAKLLVSSEALTEYKGAMTEQYVAQQLIAGNFRPFYWSKDNSTAEIDFLIQSEDRVVALEVKAEKNVKSKSLLQFVTDNPEIRGIRFSMLDYQKQDWMTNIPLYCINILPPYLKKTDN